MENCKLNAGSVSKIVSSLGSLNSMVATATNNPDLFSHQDKALSSLSNTIKLLDSFVETSREKEARPLRREVKHLRNLLDSLSSGIAEEEIDVTEFIESLCGEVSERVSSLEVLTSELVPEDQLLDSELGLESDSSEGDEYRQRQSDLQSRHKQIDVNEDPTKPPKPPVSENDYQKAVRKLNNYDKFKARLASKLQTDSSFAAVELPIVVRFADPRLNAVAVLDSAFPGQVDPVGVSSKKAADVSLVLKNQIVFQFSKSHSLEFVQEQLKEDSTADRLATARQVVNNLRKSKRKLEKELEDLTAEESELKKAKQYNVVSKARIAKRRVEIATRLEKLEISIDQNAERVKEAQSVKRAKVKVNLKPEAAYFTRVNEFLEQLAKRGKHYTMLSSNFLISPANSDIVLVWVVTVAQYKALERISKSNTKVVSWGLPWSSKTTARSTELPSSMLLSTKVR